MHSRTGSGNHLHYRNARSTYRFLGATNHLFLGSYCLYRSAHSWCCYMFQFFVLGSSLCGAPLGFAFFFQGTLIQFLAHSTLIACGERSGKYFAQLIPLIQRASDQSTKPIMDQRPGVYRHITARIAPPSAPTRRSYS